MNSPVGLPKSRRAFALVVLKEIDKQVGGFKIHNTGYLLDGIVGIAQQFLHLLYDLTSNIRLEPHAHAPFENP